MSHNKILRRIDHDMRKVEREAVHEATSLSDSFVREILKEYRRTGRIAEGVFQEKLLRPLKRAMYAVSLVGQQRGRLLMQRRAKLKLDTQSDLIITLEKLLDIDAVDEAQDIWETEALRVLNDVGPKIELDLRKKINSLIEIGTPTAQATSILRDAFDALGVTSRNPYQIESIFRTQSQIAYQAGRWKADQDPDIQEILWGYEYATVEDVRVRPEHVALQGTILPKDNDFWTVFWPPNGWSCRCQVLPVFEKTRIKNPPKNIQPDEGFSFNPGIVFG